jgi:hypothetical protein
MIDEREREGINLGIFIKGPLYYQIPLTINLAIVFTINLAIVLNASIVH